MSEVHHINVKMSYLPFKTYQPKVILDSILFSLKYVTETDCLWCAKDNQCEMRAFMCLLPVSTAVNLFTSSLL